MIVISGALVLVALVLLVAGLLGDTLVLVYLSIGVSIVSALALLAGVLQRRGEPLDALDPVEDLESTRIIAPAAVADRDLVAASRSAATPVASAPVAEVAPVDAALEDEEYGDEELEYGGTVFIVDGRPRYHVDGCRYLTGKEAEALDVLDARDEGFTPCGVCRPDEALEEALLEEEAADEVDDLDELDEVEDELEDETGDTLEDDEPEDDEVDDLDEEIPAPAAVTPAAKKATGASKAAPAKATKAAKATAPAKSTKAPAKATKTAKATAAAPAQAEAVVEAPVKASAASKATKAAKAPAKAAAAKATKAPAAKATTTPAKAASTKATKAPAKTTAKAAPAKATSAAASAPRGQVVIIPDRDKFHRADCRYVRDADDAQLVTKSVASRRGFSACGLCKP